MAAFDGYVTEAPLQRCVMQIVPGIFVRISSILLRFWPQFGQFKSENVLSCGIFTVDSYKGMFQVVLALRIYSRGGATAATVSRSFAWVLSRFAAEFSNCHRLSLIFLKFIFNFSKEMTYETVHFFSEWQGLFELNRSEQNSHCYKEVSSLYLYLMYKSVACPQHNITYSY